MIISLGGPARRGTANSTLLTSWDFGMGLGILGGGIIAEHVGFLCAFQTVAALHVLALLLFLLLQRKTRERNA